LIALAKQLRDTGDPQSVPSIITIPPDESFRRVGGFHATSGEGRLLSRERTLDRGDQGFCFCPDAVVVEVVK
jgi:hypothetical protein